MSSRKKVLIVDDSEMNRSLLSDMLSDQYDIIEADNGEEGAEILQNHEEEISLMLLDIVMPVMDGFELLDLMNKKGWIKSIPVIMISAEKVHAYIDRAYDLGVMEFISRPFDERTVQYRVSSTIMLVTRQKELTAMVTEQMYEKEKSNRMMIEILSNLVEFRNGESGLHVLRVQIITEIILTALMEKTDQYGLSEEDCRQICNAAALHDIGKLTIPMKILNKPEALTDAEFAIMKTHAAEGARFLDKLPFGEDEPLIRYAKQICRWHHERYDGGGYPDGLKGEAIPIAAQVVALADVYDALTSQRVYKEAYSHKKAMEMILDGQCGVFHPLLLDCLEESEEILQEKLAPGLAERKDEEEILRGIDKMIKGQGLSMSERTLHLLERERKKVDFLAEISREICFEYTAVPEMVTLSEWSTDHLGLPEVITRPRESQFGNGVFRQEDFEHLLYQLRSTTPEEPDIEEVYLLHIRGRERWSKVIARSLWSSEDTIEYEGAIGKILDIHDDVEKVQRLEEMAERDPLTNLLNQKTAKEQVTELLAGETSERYIMIFFDLDDFKLANDRYGHLFGDEVLLHVAHVLHSNLRSRDIVARMGGDEFMAFMECPEDVEGLAKRLIAELSGEFRGFPLGVSMGIAFSDSCDSDYETLFHAADTAMYKAKERGKGNYYICH